MDHIIKALERTNGLKGAPFRPERSTKPNFEHILEAIERARLTNPPTENPSATPDRPSQADARHQRRRLQIIEAIERAKISNAANAEKPSASPDLSSETGAANGSHRRGRFQITDVDVSATCLEKMRVIAHDPADPRTRSFDILRTQVLQAMDVNEWRVVAVTSPTAGCGKTFTSINLALSAARQPDSAVLLVDLDLQKPQIGRCLGIKSTVGMRALLEGRSALQEAITHVAAGGVRFGILPCERASSHSSDWIASPSLAATLQALKNDRDLRIVILDLPPMLSGDDVISVLPYVDCVLMVAAVGTTTTVELTECARYLSSTPLVRIVLNKVPEATAAYY